MVFFRWNAQATLHQLRQPAADSVAVLPPSRLVRARAFIRADTLHRERQLPEPRRHFDHIEAEVGIERLRLAVPAAWPMRVQRSCMSSAVCVNNPAVSSDGAKGNTPSRGSNPTLGLNPDTPQNDAGRSIEPSVCVPNANGTIPAATATAEPLELPPGV